MFLATFSTFPSLIFILTVEDNKDRSRSEPLAFGRCTMPRKGSITLVASGQIILSKMRAYGELLSQDFFKSYLVRSQGNH